jgi:hypothetical protein
MSKEVDYTIITSERDSKVVEFYGIQINIDDMKRVVDSVKYYKIFRYHPVCMRHELNIIKSNSKIDTCNDVYMGVGFGLDDDWCVVIGKKLNSNSKILHDINIEMNITSNPSLSNDILEKMKKLHELFEVNKPFESYELVHKIYNTEFRY